ncbi:MAG: PilZ domain-containing protein [Myxococcota bacterium]
MEILLAAMDGTWRVPAELVDVAARGARVKVRLDQVVPAAVGKSLTVWLVDKTAGIELPIEAKLVHRREDPDGRVLGVEFIDLRTVGGLLHPVLGRALNRRAAFRVNPARSEGKVKVMLVAPPHLVVPMEAGTLVDVSTGGLAVDAPIAFEIGLEGTELFDVMFKLPQSDVTITASARIQHRTLLQDKVVRYGAQFLNTDDPAFRKNHDTILGYVIRRQREMAEEHELNHGVGIPIGALSRARL